MRLLGVADQIIALAVSSVQARTRSQTLYVLRSPVTWETTLWATNKGMCHKLSINLNSVGPGFLLSTLAAGTLLQYLLWMSVIVRGLSATREDLFRVDTGQG
jgi:hypothetical protein